MDKALAIQREVQIILGTDQVFLCGGAVRDIVMGNTPKDYDFCTPMLPDDIVERVETAGRHVYAIGKAFGTIGFKVKLSEENIKSEPRVPNHEAKGTFVVKTSDAYEYVEVTTFRSEVYTNKSRKPEVKFVPSLDEDLARRDFTMNAMVLKADGKIYDPYGGRLDIHAKQIKTVGMPKDRIQEDPLRMLRAARFAARYDFTIDPNFIGKARQLADRIYDVSIERWVQELDKLFTSTYEPTGTRVLDQMCLLHRILPEFYSESGSDFPHAKADQKVYESADLAWRDLLLATNENPKTARYVAAGICARLKFSNSRTKIILDK